MIIKVHGFEADCSEVEIPDDTLCTDHRRCPDYPGRDTCTLCAMDRRHLARALAERKERADDRRLYLAYLAAGEQHFAVARAEGVDPRRVLRAVSRERMRNLDARNARDLWPHVNDYGRG